MEGPQINWFIVSKKRTKHSSWKLVKETWLRTECYSQEFRITLGLLVQACLCRGSKTWLLQSIV